MLAPSQRLPRGFSLLKPCAALLLLTLLSGVVLAAQPIAKNTPSTAAKTVQTNAAKKPLAPLPAAKLALVNFKTAPFPYRGLIPDSGKHFLDASEGNRTGHSTRDGVHWEDAIYRDSRVLLYMPAGFDIRKPALMVVFFHGNGALLTRDVIERQQVVEQLARSGANAVLVAPQFAIDAADSSAGRFWQRRGFIEFVGEAGVRLVELYGDKRAESQISQMPVVLVAYSGGYLPAAWSLAIGGAGRRLRGVVMLDAMYGNIDKFTSWVEQMRWPTFFLSAYTESSREGNEAFMQELKEANLRFKTVPPKNFSQGGVTILSTDPNTKHEDFVTRAWVDNPLRWVLERIPGFARYSKPVKQKTSSIQSK